MYIDPKDIRFLHQKTDAPSDQLEAMQQYEQVKRDPLAGLFSIHHISLEHAEALFELGLLNEVELAFVWQRI